MNHTVCPFRACLHAFPSHTCCRVGISHPLVSSVNSAALSGGTCAFIRSPRPDSQEERGHECSHTGFVGTQPLLHPGEVPRSGTARSYCNCMRHFIICCQTVFLKWLHHFAECNWFSKISDKIKIWENPKARNESAERAQSYRVEQGPEGWRGAHTEEHHLHHRSQCRCRLVLRDLTGRFYL